MADRDRYDEMVEQICIDLGSSPLDRRRYKVVADALRKVAEEEYQRGYLNCEKKWIHLTYKEKGEGAGE